MMLHSNLSPTLHSLIPNTASPCYWHLCCVMLPIICHYLPCNLRKNVSIHYPWRRPLFTKVFGLSWVRSYPSRKDGQVYTSPSEIFTLSLCCTRTEPLLASFSTNTSKLWDGIASWAVLGLVVRSVELASLLWDSCSIFCATSLRDNLFLSSLIEPIPPINISSMNEIS